MFSGWLLLPTITGQCKDIFKVTQNCRDLTKTYKCWDVTDISLGFGQERALLKYNRRRIKEYMVGVGDHVTQENLPTKTVSQTLMCV